MMRCLIVVFLILSVAGAERLQSHRPRAKGDKNLFPNPLQNRRELHKGKTKCYQNDACVQQGRDKGYCCPTRQGCYLSCCDSSNYDEQRGTCYTNRQCYDQGYRGHCCPSPYGVYLSCCDSHPTQPPTFLLTYSPTGGPTDHPSKAPSPAPTKAPSDSPTDSPTYHPTDSPTRRPTEAPTDYPTKAPVIVLPPVPPVPPPTPYPTKHPSPYPTDAPTPYPSNPPTPGPTHAPTPYPTKQPTPYPTDAPIQLRPDLRKCSNNPGCAALDLLGECCPSVRLQTMTMPLVLTPVL